MCPFFDIVRVLVFIMGSTKFANLQAKLSASWSKNTKSLLGLKAFIKELHEYLSERLSILLYSYMLFVGLESIIRLVHTRCRLFFPWEWEEGGRLHRCQSIE